jgi:hypothetical protein
MKQKQKQESVAARVVREIEQDAHYRKAIELGIANLSAIADIVATKLECNREAAKVAVARYAKNRVPHAGEKAGHVSRVLRQSSVSLQDSVAVLVVENSGATVPKTAGLEGDDIIAVVSSKRSTTITCRGNAVAALEKKFKGSILKFSQNLCLVQLSSPESIENVPGVFVSVLDAIYRRGINVLEASSCYTDTNIIVERRDAVKCFEAVEEACGKS